MKNLILLLIFMMLVFSNSLFAGDIEITISGADAPVNGSVYTVTGGEAPYTWDISCGSISADGVVSGASNCCGKGIVTVTDDCGYEAEKIVRMPKGKWVTQSDVSYGNCNSTSGCTLEEGIYKTTFRWFLVPWYGYLYGPYCVGESTCGGFPSITGLWYGLYQAYWISCSSKTYLVRASQYDPYPFLCRETISEWVCQ